MKKEKQKIFIYESMNCNRRKLDAKRISDFFEKNGHEIVNSPKSADIIILSTCAYSDERTNYSLKMVKKLLKNNAKLIVTGCLPEIGKNELKQIFNGPAACTYNLEKIDSIFPNQNIKFIKIEDANILWENQDEKIISKFYQNISKRNPAYKYITEFRKDAFFIRPAWGCLGTCSYCAIKKAIGPLISKPVEKIVKEFKNGLEQGYKKFIFDADDLGAYGFDINSNYAKMLDEVLSNQGDYEVHVRYIHPKWIVKYIDDFEKIIKKGKIKSVGISIQSASPRILKLMHRYSDVDKIKGALKKLKKSNSKLILETECINGFPTETKEDYTKTLDFVKDIPYDWGTIFPYSCKSGTKAEQLEPKISKSEIGNRMKYAKKYLEDNGFSCFYIKKSNVLIFGKN